MINGIAHTPTQADSHAELQARQGWSVAAMREQMDAKDLVIDRQAAEIDALKKELYNVRNHWSQYNTSFFARVRNAINYLALVNCGNLCQAYINCAVLELKDIDRRRNSK